MTLNLEWCNWRGALEATLKWLCRTVFMVAYDPTIKRCNAENPRMACDAYMEPKFTTIASKGWAYKASIPIVFVIS